MITTKNKLFKVIGMSKVYFTRASTYLSVLNFLMIMTTLKVSYNIKISAFVVAPIGLVFAMIVGYIDYKLIMLNETSHSHQKNGLKLQLNDIEHKLDMLSKQLPKEPVRSGNYWDENEKHTGEKE